MKDIILISNRANGHQLGQLAGGRVILGEINSLLGLLNMVRSNGLSVGVQKFGTDEELRAAFESCRHLIVDGGRVTATSHQTFCVNVGGTRKMPFPRHEKVFLYSYWRVAKELQTSAKPCRFLVPWPYDGHRHWIGWGYPAPPTSKTTLRAKEGCGVLWQKNPKVFLDNSLPAYQICRRVMEAFQYHNVPLNITADIPLEHLKTRFWKPGLVEVLGVLQHQQWIDLLRRSKFVVGVGTPVLGPTVTDALMNGCVLMCARQQIPESLQANRNVRCTFDRDAVATDSNAMESWIRGSTGLERTAMRLCRSEEEFDFTDIPVEYLESQHRKRCLKLFGSTDSNAAARCLFH